MAPVAGDILFADTNVLLTATDESRPQHRSAGRLLSEAGARGLHLAARRPDSAGVFGSGDAARGRERPGACKCATRRQT